MQQLFEAQVERSPDAIALVCQNQKLTYRELNARANQLAHFLQRRGVKPDVLVGICAERSPEIVIGILGILKAGGAYVPLDPAYPQERSRFILTETRVPLLLTQRHLAGNFSDLEIPPICFDADGDAIGQHSRETPICEATPEHLAYVMYTSGSTGKPKGVQLTRSNVFCYIPAVADILQVRADDIYLHVASFSFSSSVRQLMVPLSRGATSIIATREQTKNPIELFQLIVGAGITISDGVHSVWQSGLQALENLESWQTERLKNSRLRAIILSGDLPPVTVHQKLRQFFENKVRYFNIYGQTETVGNCAYAVPPDFDRREGYIPVGYPYPHNQAYIFNEDLQPVAGDGEVGELHMAGGCLARGYLNRPDLNAEKYIANPLNPEQRLFKTGDLARYRPDGAIELLGRVDFQVKIRGQRIELGEIEAVLEQHPDLKAAAVIARDDASGDKRLVAYLVPKLPPEKIDKTDAIDGLRSFLREKLVEYMIPSAFVFLEALPLTPNGKRDRMALPDLEAETFAPDPHFVAPRDALETQLADIWKQVLKVQAVGVKSDFFDLGGNSLLAVEMVTRVQKKIGKNIPLAVLLKVATIEELANLIRDGKESNFWSAVVPIKPTGYKQPFFCVHGRLGNVINLEKLAKYCDAERPFYGLQARGLDGIQKPLDTAEEIADYYIREMQKIQPRGPYLLGGQSFGGIIAFEMAQQLVGQGEEVATVILLDTYGYGTFERITFRKEHYWSYLLRLKNGRMLLKESEFFLKQMALKIYGTIHYSWGRVLSQKRRSAIIREANMKARNNYTPRVYPGRLVLLRSSEPPRATLPDMATAEDWQKRDPQQGWGPWAAAGLSIYDVPGNHDTMFNPPHVQILAERLNYCLNETEF